jgi:hypothetical protein
MQAGDYSYTQLTRPLLGTSETNFASPDYRNRSRRFRKKWAGIRVATLGCGGRLRTDANPRQSRGLPVGSTLRLAQS